MERVRGPPATGQSKLFRAVAGCSLSEFGEILRRDPPEGQSCTKEGGWTERLGVQKGRWRGWSDIGRVRVAQSCRLRDPFGAKPGRQIAHPPDARVPEPKKHRAKRRCHIGKSVGRARAKPFVLRTFEAYIESRPLGRWVGLEPNISGDAAKPEPAAIIDQEAEFPRQAMGNRIADQAPLETLFDRPHV